MSFYNVVNQASMQAGQPEDIGPVLSNFNAIASVLNGGIDNSNIAAGANIDSAKLNLPPTVGLVPIGGMVDYAGVGDPLGGNFLLADGRLLSRSAYPALFAALGTAYGAGDGSTTFGIPDCRGRTTVGPDNMGTPAGDAARLSANDARGNVGGEEKHAQTLVEVGVHSHTMGTESADHTHVVSGTTSGRSAGHTHSVGSNQAFDNTHTGTGAVVTGLVAGGGGGAPVATGGESVDHTHTFSDTSSGRNVGHTHTVNNSGSGTPFNVMQPYQVLNKIIRVL
jgi:microcystin-dependent protein